MKDGRRRRSVTIPAGIEGKCHRIGKSYQLQKALNMTDYDRYLRFQSQLLRPLLGPSEGEEWGASEEDSKKNNDNDVDGTGASATPPAIDKR